MQQLGRRGRTPKPAAPALTEWKPTNQELTLLAQAAETAEHHAGAADVAEAAQRVATLLRDASSRALVFSGAGISTPAGVGDYRGKSGKW